MHLRIDGKRQSRCRRLGKVVDICRQDSCPTATEQAIPSRSPNGPSFVEVIAFIVDQTSSDKSFRRLLSDHCPRKLCRAWESSRGTGHCSKLDSDVCFELVNALKEQLERNLDGTLDIFDRNLFEQRRDYLAALWLLRKSGLD